MRAGICDLPPANWIVQRVSNGHAHAVWTLADPIHKYSTARVEPLRHFARIAEYFAETLGADPGYSGLLAHNPQPKFRDEDFRTAWGREAPYSLDQMASVIPFNWSPPSVRQTGVGRNVDLFEAGLRWAGRQANAATGVLAALNVANQDFDHPLPSCEIAATAKSIEKYRKRWAAHGWHCPKWILRQAARGKAGGIKSGETKRARGVQGPQRQSAGAGSNESLKPWEAEGIDRATWYRHRRKAHKATPKMAISLNTNHAYVQRTRGSERMRLIANTDRRFLRACDSKPTRIGQ